MKQQRGGVLVGIIIGVVVGLAAALAVAVYVTKVPVPFMNKGQTRSAEQDAAETRKNQNWDPNAPLYGKNPARPASAAASGVLSGIVPGSAASAPGPATGTATAALSPKAAASAARAAAAADKADGKPVENKPAVTGDPLGDLAKAKAALAPGADPFLYFVQAGAFRTPEDAEAQRAKLSLMGVEAKVSEREQSGRTVYRVRLGPFDKKEDADKQKDKLDGSGVETALVRVQR